MKTFLSALGGLATVGALAAFLYAVALNVHWFVIGIAAACVTVIVGLMFYLGYTFTREVILGGR